MIAFIQVFWMTVKAVALSIFDPFFWIIIGLIAMQYKNKIDIERRIMGHEQEPLKELILDSVFYGFLASIIGSVIIIFLGITIENIGFQYVWPLAILLMLINPRYICFSYAGGIISLISLIVGFPKVNVPGLMAIVGVLHLMESMLIYIDGHRNSTPVFLELDDGRIAGGFSMQKFWPIPFAALIVVSGISGGHGVNMPDWWPIIKPMGTGLNNIMFVITTGIAALGYGDIALTRLPVKKSRVSAARLFLFSIILILLSAGGMYRDIFKYAAAVFGPVAHELLILKGQRDEKDRKPLFIAPENGIMILAAAKDSPAEKIGLKPGDIILKINDIPVNREEDVLRILMAQPVVMWITVRELNGNYVNYEYRDSRGVSGLGILIVPRHSSTVYKMSDTGIFAGKLKNFFSRIFKRRH